MRKAFGEILALFAAVFTGINLGALYHEYVNGELLIIVMLACLVASAILGAGDK